MKADVEELVRLGLKSSVIEAPTSEIKLKAYGISPEEVLRRVVDAVSFAKQNGITVAFFAVDGTRTDLEFLKKVYLAALNAGADDYLTKDASLPHLLARIAALFRRSDLLTAPKASEETLERGALSLDLKRLSVHWGGERIELTLTEFWMVHALARFPGHVKDRGSLMRDAKIVVDDSTITSHIKRIRKKFLAADPTFDCIATVYGMGYRWTD